jgi:hypothetical protein
LSSSVIGSETRGDNIACGRRRGRGRPRWRRAGVNASDRGGIGSGWAGRFPLPGLLMLAISARGVGRFSIVGLTGTLSCSLFDPVPETVTIRVVNASCATGQCTPVHVLGFPSEQPTRLAVCGQSIWEPSPGRRPVSRFRVRPRSRLAGRPIAEPSAGRRATGCLSGRFRQTATGSPPRPQQRNSSR